MFRRQSQHVFDGERLGAFSDAVFSIIATIMIIPLKISKEDVSSTAYGNPFDLLVYIATSAFLPKVFIYVYAYLLVGHIWYAHNRIFRLVEQVDDFITCCNLVVLLVSSLLPAAILLVSYNPSSGIAITITSVCTILINLSMITMVAHALRSKYLLHPDLLRMDKLLKVAIFLPLIVSAVTAGVTVLFALAISEPAVGSVFFYSNVITSTGSRVVVWLITIRTKKKNRFNDALNLLKYKLVSKERLIAFSDGVFAIVATLVVLDITTIDIPEDAENGYDVARIIEEKRYIFTTYLASFIIVGLLWFIHHSVFQFIKHVTTALSTFNYLSLFFVSLIPFGAGVFGLFADGTNSSNEVVSIRIIATILVLASTSLFLLWSVAHCQKTKCLSPEVDQPTVELLQLCKLLIYPLLGFVSYSITFSSSVVIHHFFSIMVFCSPMLFIAPKLLLYLVSCCAKTRPVDDIPRPESSVSNIGRYHIQSSTDFNEEATNLNKEQDHLLDNCSPSPQTVTVEMDYHTIQSEGTAPSPTDPSLV